MNIALYFSGRVNTYEEQIDYFKNLKDLYNIDYFCSINGIQDEYHDTFIKELDIKSYFFEQHESIFDDSWISFPTHLSYADRDYTLRMSSHFYNNKKAFELIEKYQEEHDIKYDIIIKFRADIISDEIFPIIQDIKPDYIYIPKEWDWDWRGMHGINDHIAYGSSEVMKIYSNLFPYIKEYCSEHSRGYHPESLLLYHLQRNEMKIERFNYTYTHNKNRYVFKSHSPTSLNQNTPQETGVAKRQWFNGRFSRKG